MFATVCAVCHQANGLGQRMGSLGDARGYVFPPLWGPDSFNDGAGMDRYQNIVGFVRRNMPRGVDPQLVIFFDSGNLERSGSSVKQIATHATIVNIDHHPSNSRFGDLNVIEPDASAVGQMVMVMLDHFGLGSTVTKRASGVSSGILVHQDY